MTSSRRRLARGSLEILVLALVLLFALQAFVVQTFEVQGASMEQTLADGDLLVVDKLSPRLDGYHRGDVVVFTPPAEWAIRYRLGAQLIKRVIGVAGDRVELRSDGGVAVNGSVVEEPYLYGGADGMPQATTPLVPGQTRWEVGPGELFVMGDHRADSLDSRLTGPIPVDAVVGRAWLRYWPLGSFGLPTSEGARPLPTI